VLLYLVSIGQCMMLAYSIGICVDEKYKKEYRDSAETINGYIADVKTTTRTIVTGPEGEYTEDQGYIPHYNERRKQVSNTTWTVLYKCNETVCLITTTTPLGDSSQVGETVSVSVLEGFAHSGRVTADTTKPPPTKKERLQWIVLLGGFGSVMVAIAAVCLIGEFIVPFPITVSLVGAVYIVQSFVATVVTTMWYSRFWSVRHRAKRVRDNQIYETLQGDGSNTSSTHTGCYCETSGGGSSQMFP